MASLITIRRYRDLSEAIVARSLLESCGITVYLYDENLVRLDWQISNFIGGIRLQVESTDEQDATAALDSPAPTEIDYGLQASTYRQPHCPHCGSTEIDSEGSSRKAALTALYVFSVPLPLGPKTWRCYNCKNHRNEAVS